MSGGLQRGAILAACADMIRACGLSAEDLVQHMGQVAASPAVHIAARPVAHRALSQNDRQVIASAGAADGATVSSVMALLGLRDAQAHRYCAILTQAGYLTGVKKPGIRAMRFFSSPDGAKAWAESDGIEAAPAFSAALTAAEIRSIEIRASKIAAARKSPPPMGARTKRVQPGRPGADMLVRHGTASPPPPSMPKATAEPIFTDKTVRTIDDKKRPTARWQLQQEAPDERWPSFAAARPGIDPSTGAAWGARG
jgi:hypothetical protein